MWLNSMGVAVRSSFFSIPAALSLSLSMLKYTIGVTSSRLFLYRLKEFKRIAKRVDTIDKSFAALIVSPQPPSTHISSNTP